MSRNSTKNKFDFSLYRSYWISTNAFSRFYSAFCVCWLWSFINCAFCYLIFKKSEREREREKEIWKLSKNVLKEISRYFMNNISIFFLQSVFMNDYFFFYSILFFFFFIIIFFTFHRFYFCLILLPLSLFMDVFILNVVVWRYRYCDNETMIHSILLRRPDWSTPINQCRYSALLH